jgi:hypothetical protein
MRGAGGKEMIIIICPPTNFLFRLLTAAARLFSG